MPWCTSCDRFLSPSTVAEDGTCPRCGRAVEQGEVAARAHEHAADRVADPDGDRDGDEELAPIPWHLKLLAVAVAIYLGWRLVQGIEWLLG